MAVRSRVLLVWAALAGGALVGCKSDEAIICEKLDACHLLQKGPHFQETDCEYQVENELKPSARDSCAECVSNHQCGEIVNACRTTCNPPY
jgi:hypothetical protein